MAACGIMKLTRRRKRSSEPTTPTRKTKKSTTHLEPRIDIYPALVINSGGCCPPCHFVGMNKGWEIEIDASIARGEITFTGNEKKLTIKGRWPEVMNTIEESFRLFTETPEEEVSGKFTLSIKIRGSDIQLETKGQTRVDVGGNHWCPTYSMKTQSFPASGPKGQYQPITVLGRAGRSGAVWLCYFIPKQKFVACKVGLREQHDIYDEWKAYQNIKAAADKADLKYLLIPKLYAEVDGHDWVVMPLRGDNMEDIWMSGKMEYTKWKAVIIASLRGIKALHSTGTLHDDIKFGNIISSKPAPKTEAFLRAWQQQHYPNAVHKDVVTTPPPLLSPHKGKVGHHIEAYVVDLDGARRLLEQPTAISSNCSHAFRSPEGKLGNALSLASDIWSIGATAFYLLTGLNITEDDDSQLQFWVEALGWPKDPILREQIEKIIGNKSVSSENSDIGSLVMKSMENRGPVEEVIRLLKCMLCWEPEMRLSAESCLLMARMLP